MNLSVQSHPSASGQLKILHTESSLAWGGQEIRVLTEAAGMQQRGHQIWVAAPAEALITQRAPQFGVTAIPLPIGKKRLRGWLALRRWLRAHPIDIINTHSSTDTWLAALACLTLARAPRIVRTRHISAPVKANWQNRWLYGRAVRRVVTTGEAIRELLLNTLQLPPAHVVSIPTGINLQRYRPATEKPFAPGTFGFPENALVVGIVATLRSWKGHRYLVEALSHCPANVCLLIVGDGPGWEPLHTQVAALGLQTRIRLVGNQSDVVPYLQSMDVFCLPSYANEGVPQALLQAMACALPVISTSVGAIPEIITPDVNGLLVPAQDPAALRQAIQQLLSDPALRIQLGQSGRVHAQQHAALEHMLVRMESVFRQAFA